MITSRRGAGQSFSTSVVYTYAHGSHRLPRDDAAHDPAPPLPRGAPRSAGLTHSGTCKSPGMAGNRPEEQVPVPMAYQTWRHVTFLHWRCDPASLRRVLPEGLTPDVVDGSAWVALTPFLVEGFRVPGVPALPWLSRFPETNLRTYVRDAHGGEGLWFLSIDVGSGLLAGSARLGLGVPYLLSRMRVQVGASLVYESRRITGRPAHHRIEVVPGKDLGDRLSRRDALLVGRWRAYSRRAGRLVQVPVQHQPWPVHEADLVELEESVTATAGLNVAGEAPLVHYAPRVDARLGLPRLVGSSTGLDPPAPTTCEVFPRPPPTLRV